MHLVPRHAPVAPHPASLRYRWRPEKTAGQSPALAAPVAQRQAAQRIRPQATALFRPRPTVAAQLFRSEHQYDLHPTLRHTPAPVANIGAPLSLNANSPQREPRHVHDIGVGRLSAPMPVPYWSPDWSPVFSRYRPVRCSSAGGKSRTPRAGPSAVKLAQPLPSCGVGRVSGVSR